MIRITSIASGNQGTWEKLRVMAGLTREAAADSYFSGAAKSFFYHPTAGEVDAQIRYFYTYTNEAVETLYSPIFNMKRYAAGADIIGDCDDVSMFLAAVLKVKGYRTRFVALRTRRHDPEFYHVVVEALEHGKWKRFDPTVIQGLMQVDYGQMVEYV